MRYSIFTLFATLVISFSFGQIEKRVCFLGNSYTASNNLPNLVQQLATADGNTLITDSNTPGGYTLEGHSTNATSLTKIAEEGWDFVILQDQSQRPSFPWTQVSVEVFPFAEILCDSIRSANECAIPLFYNTWGRRDGDDQWDSINTFTKMNQRLHVAYDYMADKNSGMLAPIGIGFEHVANDLGAPITHAELYVGDGSHPSIFGSYMAACIFYEVIFATSSIDNTFIPAGITTDEALYLQNVAHHVLTEVDSVTTDYTIPEASYSVEYDGLTATFTNTSVHAFSYHWDFGDGETSTQINPIHVYPDDGEYTATLTAIYCDKESVTTDGLNHTGIKENSFPDFNVFPNPSTNQPVTIVWSGEETTLFVYDTNGKLIHQQIINTGVEMNLEKGVYFVRIQGTTRRVIIY